MYNQSYNDIKRNIKYPKESKELAELIGIIFGDGSMNIYKKRTSIAAVLTIVGHSIDDKDYLTNHVTKLIEKLFNIKPTQRIRKEQQVLELRIGSKGIVNFLETKGIKLGPKINLETPDWILKKEDYIIHFIRGLTDTDGSLAVKKRYREKPYYPTIKITSKISSLILLKSNL